MGLLLWLVATLVGAVVGHFMWYWVVFQAFSCFVFGLPKAIDFWSRGLLTSWVPAAKYMALGIGYSVGGYFLGRWLWGVWNPGFRIGLSGGFLMTLVFSISRSRGPESWFDFYTMNSEHVDWDAVEEAAEDID